MSKTLTPDEFYLNVKALVDDAIAFQETEQCRDFEKHHVPGRYYRHIKLAPRRAIGKTYAALRLANDYEPTMLVFPTPDLMKRAVRDHNRHEYYPTNPDFAFHVRQVLDHEFLPTLGCLGQGGRYIFRDTPERFKLGIIDDAVRIYYNCEIDALNKLRDIMSITCDVILELG